MTPGERLAARLQCAAARFTDRLPDPLTVLLSGEPPVEIDGQRLDPQLQLIRCVRRRRAPTRLLAPTIAAARERYRAETRVFRGPATRVGEVRGFDLPGAHQPLGARHYAPSAQHHADPAPLTVYLHGGGFAIGDLDTHDEPCRMLCRHASIHVLSIDYRLAPEHPFPAAVEDAIAAYEWARAHAVALGADPRRVSIAGDSAGGTLAAVVSALTSPARNRPHAQLLIYPATDASTPRRSHKLFGREFLLTALDRNDFFDAYVRRGGARREDPRVSPLKAADLSGLPPTLLGIAGFDLLPDEGEAYAAALSTAGSDVYAPSLEHGFIHMSGVCAAARLAVCSLAARWGALLRERALA